MPELAFVLALAVLALVATHVLRASRAGRGRERWAGLAAVAVAVAIACSGLTVGARGEAPRPPQGRPPRSSAPEWVTSAACLPCHPGEHASFARTYHRTMTQDASPRAVLAPLDGAPLAAGGEAARLLVREGKVVAETGGEAREVVLLTGSHREQAYWVAGARPGELRLFPFVWVAADRRLVARREAFLLPPEAPMPEVRWGSSCIACHAVAGEPRRDAEADVWGTRIAELGVACEACHGPGRAHVEQHRDPFERWAARREPRATRPADPTITSPRRLSPERSAAVCGQCHAFAYPKDEAGWWQTGYARAFRPGDALTASRFLLAPATLADPRGPRVDAEVESLYWRDGTVRVGGREYNGLVASPCFERGEGERKLTCTSCHAMHAGDPAGQIAEDRRGDAACTSCHDAARAQAHTHHAAGSPGSACVACHMPRTSYALLSATRSHRISSPSVTRTLETGEPSACTLCHLDRSLAWTSRALARWTGRPDASAGWSPEDAKVTVPEGLRAALVGDAAVRVVVADALGRAEGGARGPEIELARLVLSVDPYAAVRQVAARGAARSPRGPTAARPEDLDLDPRLRELLARRDARAVTIAE